MPKKKSKNFDRSLVGQYIRQIENPDSIGWNPNNRTWGSPILPGYDLRNRGMGIDIINNADARALVEGRPDAYLTEAEERQLRNAHINYSSGVLDRYNRQMGVEKISPQKEAEAIGLIYRGDGPQLKDPKSLLGKAYRSKDEDDFHRAVSEYYKAVGVSERARNNDSFWQSQNKEGFFTPITNKYRDIINKYTAPQNGGIRADGGSISHWNNLSMREKAEMMRIAIDNGITNLADIRQAYNEFAEGGNINPSEEVNEFGGGGYKPSERIKKRISNWEGAAMYKDTIDPLSGKMAKKNAPFETVTSGFVSVLPASIREQVLSNQELADNLFSYAYNVGPGRFRERVVPTLIKYYSGQATANDIAQSMWASGDAKLRGLRNRRAEERAGVLSALGANPVADVSIPETTMPAFTPSNPEAFFGMQTTSTPVLPFEPEENPLVEAAMKAYTEEALKREERERGLRNFSTILNLTNPTGERNYLLDTVNLLSGNISKDGGDIHIKPSHRGRLTELKARTGKSEAELYNDGNPAHKKMVVFARNSRKWKHDDGGELNTDPNIFKYTNPSWQHAILDQNDRLLPQADRLYSLAVNRPTQLKNELISIGKTPEQAEKTVKDWAEEAQDMMDIQEQRAHLKTFFKDKVKPLLKDPEDAMEIESVLNQHPELLEETPKVRLLMENLRPGSIKDYAKYFAESLGVLPFINKIDNER